MQRKLFLLGEYLQVFLVHHLLLNRIHLPECGKGEAVLWLADRLGIPQSQTMAFGDSMNDETMIRKTAYGVAMSNGLPYIQEIAKFVTRKSNEEDGIGDFIEEYVL